MHLGGWNPPGDEAPTNRWQYDVAKGWSPPGVTPSKAGTQFTFHEGFNPGATPKGFHILASPPGTAAPIDQINYTPDTKEVHQPGVLAPVDKLNYSIIPPSRMRSAARPAQASGPVPGVGSALGAGQDNTTSDWDRGRMSSAPALATSMPTPPLNVPMSAAPSSQLPNQAITPRGPGARPPYMPTSSTSTDWKGLGVGADDNGLVPGDPGYDSTTEDGDDGDPYADLSDTAAPPAAAPPPGTREGPAPVEGQAGFSGQTFPDDKHMQDWSNGKLAASWTLKPHGDPSIPADWVKDPTPTTKNPATGIQYEPPVTNPDGSVTQKGSNGRVVTVKAAPRAATPTTRVTWDKPVTQQDGSVWQVSSTGQVRQVKAASRASTTPTWSDEQSRPDGSRYQVSSTGQVRNTGAPTKAPTAATEHWTREDKPDGSVWETNDTTGATRIVYGPTQPENTKPITVGNRVVQYDPKTGKYVEIYKAPADLKLQTDSSGNILGVNPETGESQLIYEDTSGEDTQDLKNAKARQDLIPHAYIQGNDYVVPRGASATIENYDPTTKQTSTRSVGTYDPPPEAIAKPRPRSLPPPIKQSNDRQVVTPPPEDKPVDKPVDTPVDTPTVGEGLAPPGVAGTKQDPVVQASLAPPGGWVPDYGNNPDWSGSRTAGGEATGGPRPIDLSPPPDEPPPDDMQPVDTSDLGSGASTKARALGSTLQSDLGKDIPTYARRKKRSKKHDFLGRGLSDFTPFVGAGQEAGPMPGGESPPPPPGMSPPPGAPDAAAGGAPPPSVGVAGGNAKISPKVMQLILAILQEAKGQSSDMPGQSPPDASAVGGMPGQMPPGGGMDPPGGMPGMGMGAEPEDPYANRDRWYQGRDDTDIPGRDFPAGENRIRGWFNDSATQVKGMTPFDYSRNPSDTIRRDNDSEPFTPTYMMNPRRREPPSSEPGHIPIYDDSKPPEPMLPSGTYWPPYKENKPQIGSGAGEGNVPPIAPQDAQGMGHKFGQPLDSGEPLHKGTDIQAFKGTPVMAPVDGTVRIENNPNGLGLQAKIVGVDGKEHGLGHLLSVDVKDGQQVRKGQPIGKVGDSGNTTGAHLDYRQKLPDGSYKNPEPDLGQIAQMPAVPGTETMGEGADWQPSRPIGWLPSDAGMGAGQSDTGWTPPSMEPRRRADLDKGPGGEGFYDTPPNEMDTARRAGWSPFLEVPPGEYLQNPEQYHTNSDVGSGAEGWGGMGAGGMRLANGKWSDALADTPDNQRKYGQGSSYSGGYGYSGPTSPAAPGPQTNPGNSGGGDQIGITPSYKAYLDQQQQIAQWNHDKDTAQLQQSITSENNRHAEQLQQLQQQAQNEADYKAVQEAIAQENNRHNMAQEQLQAQQQQLDLKLETMKEQNAVLLQNMQNQQQTQMFGRTSKMDILNSALKIPWLAQLTGMTPKGGQAGTGIGGNNIQNLIDQILADTGGPGLGNPVASTQGPAATTSSGAPDWTTWQSWSPYQKAAWRANQEAGGPGTFENAQAGAQQAWGAQGASPNVTQLAGATADAADTAGMEMTANMFGDTGQDFWTQQNKNWGQAQAPSVKQNFLAGASRPFTVGG